MNKKERVFYYDLLKILAAFMVCFYHLGVLDTRSVFRGFYVPNFNKMVLNLCAMSVPIFFMVNGALMLRRAYSVKEVAIRFLKLIFLYFFWVIVLDEIGYIFFGIERISLLNILKGQRNTISVHLWFFRTLAILTILVPLFKKIYELKSKKILGGLFGILILFPFSYNYLVLWAQWFKIDLLKNCSVTGVFTMYAVLYFFLGKILSGISETKKKDRRYKILAVIGGVLGWLMVSTEVFLWSNIKGSVYDGVNSSFPTIGALLMALSVFYLFSGVNFRFSDRIKKIVAVCADNIMGTYIFHVVFVHVALRFIHGTVSLIEAIVLTVSIMFCTTLFTCMIKKVPFIERVLHI